VWEGPVGGKTPLVTEGTTAMPCDWHSLFGPVAGTATFSRRFHRPSNLEPHERVWLICTGVRGSGSVSLNDELLTEFSSDGEAVECEVTSRLQPFNIVSMRLSVGSIEEPQRPGGLFEPVVLEIRSE
jgi:hypothetical protein